VGLEAAVQDADQAVAELAERCVVADAAGAELVVDADSLAITASIIELARSMRLATIAEGVETIEQLMLLQSLGCWAAQGFQWSPGLAPEALADLVDRLPDRRFAVRPAATSS
jgi:EAL domain-containing protein (putative c-di-GMP-specific phosphodiesterase class I)